MAALSQNGGRRFVAMAMILMIIAGAAEASDNCTAKCFARCKDTPFSAVCLRGCSKNCQHSFSLAHFHCTLGCTSYNCNKFGSGMNTLPLTSCLYTIGIQRRVSENCTIFFMHKIVSVCFLFFKIRNISNFNIKYYKVYIRKYQLTLYH